MNTLFIGWTTYIKVVDNKSNNRKSLRYACRYTMPTNLHTYMHMYMYILMGYDNLYHNSCIVIMRFSNQLCSTPALLFYNTHAPEINITVQRPIDKYMHAYVQIFKTIIYYDLFRPAIKIPFLVILNIIVMYPIFVGLCLAKRVGIKINGDFHQLIVCVTI